MKLQRVFTILAALTLFTVGTAQAQKPASGDVALFVNNISALPMYNVGYFMSSDVMGYGSLGFTNDDNDSGVAFGVGARIYGAPGTSENIRTYWNASLRHNSEDYISSGGIASFGGGLAGRGIESTTLSADFGAEAELAPDFSVGAEVGLQWQDVEVAGGGDNSILSLGTADLTLNYYF